MRLNARHCSGAVLIFARKIYLALLCVISLFALLSAVTRSGWVGNPGIFYILNDRDTGLPIHIKKVHPTQSDTLTWSLQVSNLLRLLVRMDRAIVEVHSRS